MLTSLLGLTAGYWLRPPPEVATGAVTAPAPPVARAPSVEVQGRAEEFADLESAVAAAGDGGVLIVRGLLRCRPLRVRGKALTIRAAAEEGGGLLREPCPECAWDAFLSSDRPLTLVGLELQGRSDDLAPLVSVEGAALRLWGCKLTMPGDGPAVALRRGTHLWLEGCGLDVNSQAVAFEVAPACRVAVRRCQVTVRQWTGAVLLAWSAELTSSCAVDVALSDSRVEAGRLLACNRVTGPVRVTATANRLALRQTRVSYSGYPDPAAAQHVVTWREVEAP